MMQLMSIITILLWTSMVWGGMSAPRKLVAAGGGGTGTSIRGTSATSYASRTDTTGSPLDLTSAATLECWIKKTATSGAGDALIEKEGAYSLHITASGYLRARMQHEGASNVDVTASSTIGSYSDGWLHVAVSKDSSGTRLYINGSRVGEQTYQLDNLVQTNDTLYLVGHWWDGASLPENVDECRISNVARYTGASFTVPTSPFTSDANTVALYHLDETSGTTLDDASSNNLDLTLSGSFVLGEAGAF